MTDSNCKKSRFLQLKNFQYASMEGGVAYKGHNGRFPRRAQMNLSQFIISRIKEEATAASLFLSIEMPTPGGESIPQPQVTTSRRHSRARGPNRSKRLSGNTMKPSSLLFNLCAKASGTSFNEKLFLFHFAVLCVVLGAVLCFMNLEKSFLT
jgi:hypothetical protein